MVILAIIAIVLLPTAIWTLLWLVAFVFGLVKALRRQDEAEAAVAKFNAPRAR
jgi:hypothetical protein